MPTSTARRTRSSSQSIRSSAKARLSGYERLDEREKPLMDTRRSSGPSVEEVALCSSQSRKGE